MTDKKFYTRPQVTAVTLYVRQQNFKAFLEGDYENVTWTLTPGDSVGGFFSYKQVQVQVTLDTYYQMVDAYCDQCGLEDPHLPQDTYDGDIPF